MRFQMMMMIEYKQKLKDTWLNPKSEKTLLDGGELMHILFHTCRSYQKGLFADQVPVFHLKGFFQLLDTQ